MMRLYCGSCRLCCQLSDLTVNLELFEEMQYDQRYKAKDTIYISKNDDGVCVYLGAEGCTIYDSRPTCCVTFTCTRFLRPEWDRHNTTTRARTIKPLRKAALQLIGRHKQSAARRFNKILK